MCVTVQGKEVRAHKGSLFAWSPTNTRDISEGLHNKHLTVHNFLGMKVAAGAVTTVMERELRKKGWRQ